MVDTQRRNYIGGRSAMQGSFACREVAARVGVNAIPVKREKKNTTL